MSEIRYEHRREDGRVVRIKLGDLTAESVDAIVNAANTYLAHGGGLAAAIVWAGGEVIQRESDKVAPVPTGGAASTGAGALPCKRVIHAVGPVWSRQRPDESDRLLSSAVASALKVADAESLVSISIPAISSGIFGFPKDRCARLMLEAVEQFWTDHPETSVREINLCNFDDLTVSIFLKAASARWDHIESSG
jgi:O-acetyl-ADP-ribose deacetylase (regulator of RNase III)